MDKSNETRATEQTRMKLPFWQQLRWSLIILFVLLAILPMAIVTSVVLARTSTQANQQVYNQLDSVVELKYDQILRWLDQGELALDTLLSGPINARLTALAGGTVSAQEQSELSQILAGVAQTGYFERLFVYDAEGRVLASSNLEEVGQQIIQQPFFKVSLHADYVQAPFVEPGTGRLAMYVTRPLRGAKILASGVLAAQLNVATLAEIMTERTGLGESGETYLVSQSNYHLLTPSHFENYLMSQAYHSQGIDRAINGEKGHNAYNNYRAVAVIGSYRFIPELQAGLLAEVEQSQALSALRQAQVISVGIAAIAMLAAVALGLFSAQRISRPIAALTVTARRIGAGDLGAEVVEVQRQDEVGMLARAFRDMQAELRALYGNLEQQVAERTTEIQRRSAYLEASAQVSHAVASILDANTLVRQVADLIREQFGLYYVGLFLVEGEWAVLRAGTGEAGARMLARDHRIKAGDGMIGWSITHAQARIALEIGQDALRLASAELPNTRSEAALPLRSRGQVLGALTVQSDQPAAFDEKAIVALQTMADQVAVALDNARLFAESQKALEVERRSYGEMSRQAWAQMLRARPEWGYRCDQAGVFASTGNWQPEAQQAFREGQVTLASDDAAPAVATPIRVRDNVIGALIFSKEEGNAIWTAEETALIETLTDQLGVALDSARLYQDSQRRAARERILREVTARVRSSTDPETVLKSLLREVGTVLERQTFIRLVTSEENLVPQATGGNGNQPAGREQPGGRKQPTSEGGK